MKTQGRETVMQAKRLFTQREYDRVEPVLRKVAQDQPRYADVFNMLGVIYHAWGRFADAVQSFKKALAINGQYTEAKLNLAVLYNDLGRYKEARQLYAELRNGHEKKRGAVKIEPVLKGKLSNMHAEIGDLYFGLGHYEAAISEYERALVLNPTYVDILTKLGVSQREHGALKESAETLRKACKTKADYQQAHVQLGLTYYVMGKTADAKKEWRAILEQDPDHQYAKMYLSLCEEQ